MTTTTERDDREQGCTMTLPIEVIKAGVKAANALYGPDRDHYPSVREVATTAMTAGLTALLDLPETRKTVALAIEHADNPAAGYDTLADAAIEALRKMVGGRDGQ